MYFVIANPAARSGKSTAIFDQVCRLLNERHMEYHCHITQYARHAVLLADQAVRESAEGIVCVGGDGTINEVVSGLAGREMTLYIVPCGTGNDFVKTLNLPREPIEAFQCQLNSAPHALDVGQVNDLFFANIAGTGFDVEVLHQVSRFKRLGRGLLPYLCGVAAALRRFKPIPLTIELNGNTFHHCVTILSIGNGQYLGGGMHAVPEADPSDGLFDVLWVDPLSRRKIMRLIIHFIRGTHMSFPIVHTARCSEVTISGSDMTFNLDGELHHMNRAVCRLLPGALIMHLPDKSM